MPKSSIMIFNKMLRILYARFRNKLILKTMKSHIHALLSVCLIIPCTLAMGQDQPTQKTTTTTTTTTEQSIPIDSTKQSSTAPVPAATTTPASETQSEPSNDSWKGFHGGVVAQATFTDVNLKSENGAISTSYVVGYGAGGFLGYFFSPNAEIRAEVLYSSLAQEIVENDTKRTLNLSYINIPLLGGFHTGYDKAVSFNIMAGPQIGINVGSSLDGEGESGIDTVNASVKVKPADIGIAYGAGFDFGLGVDRLLHLNIGFRGVYGLIDISDDSNNTTTNNYYVLDRSKLNTYSGYLGLSYKF